eukprot:81248-Prymnesium_polylepis.1
MLYDQICEICGADFPIEAFKAALISLDKGQAYGEHGCYKCADTPREKYKVCKKYIAAGMVNDMGTDERTARATATATAI